MSTTLTPKKPVAPPANSAAPGTTAPVKEKKAKVKKIDHPSLITLVEGGDPIVNKLEKRPADFDPKVHNNLRAKNFVNESFFLEDQAAQLDLKAAALRAKAEKLRSLGSTASSAKAKTLIKMQERMAELLESLKKDGVDVDALMAKKS
jgi:hypothetical protein